MSDELTLYKYRSLENLEYVLDIILNEQLYCSPYEELNDPFEGLFMSPITINIVDKSSGKSNTVESMMSSNCKDMKPSEDEVNTLKICSLSSSREDVRLWSLYSDGHKGIVFEIDFTGLDSHIFKVEYSDELPQNLSGVLSPEKILSCKTNHWEYEKESRIINGETYFPIKNRIKGIYLGNRVNKNHQKIIEKIVNGKIPIHKTGIHTNDIKVVPI